MPTLDDNNQELLRRFALALVDQERARIIVPPHQNAPGFWFGGGNLTEVPDGLLYLVGRYRNAGDARAGIAAGDRGLALAIFVSRNRGQSFEKALQFSKADLNVGSRKVVSIEGSALHWTQQGVELFVSTEKDGVGYPPGFEDYLKPGTGVWSIDRLSATTIDGLRNAPRSTILDLKPAFPGGSCFVSA